MPMAAGPGVHKLKTPVKREVPHMLSQGYRVPTDQEVLDYFLLLEFGGAGVDVDVPRLMEAPPQAATCNVKTTGTSHQPAGNQSVFRASGNEPASLPFGRPSLATPRAAVARRITASTAVA